MRKKIVIITNIPSPYRVDMFNYLQNNVPQYSFYVIYTSVNEDNRQWNIDLKEQRNYAILKSRVVKIKKKLDYKYIHIPVLGELIHTLDKMDPHAIIAFEYNPAALEAFIWSRKKKRKFIHLTDGTLYSERNINVIQRVLRKVIINGSDSCIASSSAARKKLMAWGADPKKIFISFLTVSLSPYLEAEICKDSSSDNTRLLYVGSFVKRKGLDLLLAALFDVDKHFCLRIVGGGTKEEETELRRLIQSFDLEDRVSLVGFKQGEDLVKEYISSDVFILPAREDCFGLVLVEALAAGNLIIASKYADGAVDVVDNKHGYIIDPYDREQFSNVINKAILNKKMREKCISDRNENTDRFRFASTYNGYVDAIDHAFKGCE